MKNVYFVVLALLIPALRLSAQQDSLAYKGMRNTIRWNLTPNFVVGPKSFVFGYERVIKPWQSFSFNIGYMEKAPLKFGTRTPKAVLI